MHRVYFEMSGKNIGLKIGGKNVVYGRNSNEPQQKLYTLNKIKGAMNHMLYFFYENKPEFARDFIARLYNKTVTTERLEREMIFKGDAHGIEVKKNIYMQNCRLDKRTMFAIIDYVRAAIDDVDTFDNTKDRSFRRVEVLVLNIVSVHIKICFLMFLLHGSKKFEKFLDYNIFEIVGGACNAYREYLEEVVNQGVLDDRDIDEIEFVQQNDIFDSIYSYFATYGSDKWSENNEDRLKEMFYESGTDDATVQNDTFAKAISTLNRYSIIPKNDEVIAKYFPGMAMKEIKKESYDVHTMEWSDFGFIHLNFVAYMDGSLIRILKNAASSNIGAFITTASIVSDDVTQSRIEIYYEDRYSSLLPQKHDKALMVIDECSKSIANSSAKWITNRIRAVTLISKGLYNYFLNTVYGESHILSDIIGRYKVYPLTIVYMTLDRLGVFPNVVKSLMSNTSSTVSNYEKSQIRDVFSDMDMYRYAGDTFISAISEILSTYEYKDENTSEIIMIPIDELKSLLELMCDSDKMYDEFFKTLHGVEPIRVIPEDFIDKSPDILYTPVDMNDTEKQAVLDKIHKL